MKFRSCFKDKVHYLSLGWSEHWKHKLILFYHYTLVNLIILIISGSSGITPRLSSSISITKTSKNPMNLKTPTDTSQSKKTNKSHKQKISPTSNPFNISASSTKSSSSPSSSSPAKEIVLSPNNAYNRGAVEDSDEENLVIHE